MYSNRKLGKKSIWWQDRFTFPDKNICLLLSHAHTQLLLLLHFHYFLSKAKLYTHSFFSWIEQIEKSENHALLYQISKIQIRPSKKNSITLLKELKIWMWNLGWWSKIESWNRKRFDEKIQDVQFSGQKLEEWHSLNICPKMVSRRNPASIYHTNLMMNCLEEIHLPCCWSTPFQSWQTVFHQVIKDLPLFKLDEAGKLSFVNGLASRAPLQWFTVFSGQVSLWYRSYFWWSMGLWMISSI